MKQTITAKYRLYVDDPAPLVRMSEAYRDACNFVSEYMFGKGKDNVPAEQIIHDNLYLGPHSKFGLMSQMVQSVIKTVLARCSTLITRIRDSEKAAEAWDRRAAVLAEKGQKPKNKRPKESLHGHRYASVYQNP